MSDLRNNLKRVIAVLAERSTWPMTEKVENSYIEEIIAIVKDECVEAVEEEKENIDNPNGMIVFGMDISIKSINQL